MDKWAIVRESAQIMSCDLRGYFIRFNNIKSQFLSQALNPNCLNIISSLSNKVVPSLPSVKKVPYQRPVTNIGPPGSAQYENEPSRRPVREGAISAAGYKRCPPATG